MSNLFEVDRIFIVCLVYRICILLSLFLILQRLRASQPVKISRKSSEITGHLCSFSGPSSTNSASGGKPSTKDLCQSSVSYQSQSRQNRATIHLLAIIDCIPIFYGRGQNFTSFVCPSARFLGFGTWVALLSKDISAAIFVGSQDNHISREWERKENSLNQRIGKTNAGVGILDDFVAIAGESTVMFVAPDVFVWCAKRRSWLDMEDIARLALVLIAGGLRVGRSIISTGGMIGHVDAWSSLYGRPEKGQHGLGPAFSGIFPII